MNKTKFPLSALVATQGDYPQRGASGGLSVFMMGMVQMFAGTTQFSGALEAKGQSLPVSSNAMLLSLLGFSFGGNGTNFSLPDLTGRTAIGGDDIGLATNDTLTLKWLIAPLARGSNAPPVGCLIPFAGNFCPDGWLVADGTTLAMSEAIDLFMVIGTLFGGNGSSDFVLPDMTAIAAVGAGDAGGATVAVGAKVGGDVPGLGLNYLIATDGLYPSGGGFPDNQALLGQVIAYAGLTAPKGWALCDGSRLDIADNKGLFSVIGKQFGGDGVNNFALPDLRGSRLVGV